MSSLTLWHRKKMENEKPTVKTNTKAHFIDTLKRTEEDKTQNT
jgi:hypothetical protein